MKHTARSLLQILLSDDPVKAAEELAEEIKAEAKKDLGGYKANPGGGMVVDTTVVVTLKKTLIDHQKEKGD